MESLYPLMGLQIFSNFISQSEKDRYELGTKMSAGRAFQFCKGLLQRHGGLVAAFGHQGVPAEINSLYKLPDIFGIIYSHQDVKEWDGADWNMRRPAGDTEADGRTDTVPVSK